VQVINHAIMTYISILTADVSVMILFQEHYLWVYLSKKGDRMLFIH